MSEVVGEAVVVVRQDESQMDLDGAGARGGQGFASGFGGAIKNLAKIAGVAAVAAGVSKVFVGALQFDAAGAKLQAQLGLTEKQSARAGEVAGRLYADNYGEGLGQLQESVGTVLGAFSDLRRGSTADIEAATAAAQGYADVFDTDLPTAVSAAQQAVNSGLAEDAVGAFDLLTASSQKVPAALRQDLFDAAVEYAGFFDQIGMGGEQAFSALAAASDQGVFGIDKMGDAVKEFTIRATDGSDATESAYKTLGLDSQLFAENLLKGGDYAGEATQTIVDKLLGIRDPVKQANTAIALFGTPLEDLGTKNIPDFLRGLQDTEGALGKVEGATDRAVATMSDTPLAQLTGIWRSFSGEVLEVGQRVLPYVVTVIDAVQTAVPVIQSALQPALQVVGQIITGTVLPALQTAGAWVQANLLPILSQIGTIIATRVVPVLQTLGQFFLGTILPVIVRTAVAVGQSLAPVFTTLVDVVQTRILPTMSRLWQILQTQILPALLPIIARVQQVSAFMVRLGAAVLGAVLPPLIRLAGFIISTVVPAVARIIGYVLRFVGFLLDLGAAVVRTIATVARFGATLVGFVRNGINVVVDAVTALPRLILGLGPRMLSAGRDLIGKFVDGLKNAAGIVGGIAGNVWDSVKGLLNGAIDKINAALEFTISLPGPDITINPPNIPHLARGTDYFGGGLAVVGEQGRELVSLPRGARVTPHAETERLLGTDTGRGAAQIHLHYPLPEKPSTAVQRLANVPFLLGA